MIPATTSLPTFVDDRPWAQDWTPEPRLGAAFVPFTFPTHTISKAMEKYLGRDVSYREVDQIWDRYKVLTLKEGFPPYEANGWHRTLAEVEARTGYKRDVIAAWMQAVKEYAETPFALNAGYYVDPAGTFDSFAASMKQPLDAVKAGAGAAADGLKKILPDVNWGAVGIVAGSLAALYISYKLFR